MYSRGTNCHLALPDPKWTLSGTELNYQMPCCQITRGQVTRTLGLLRQPFSMTDLNMQGIKKAASLFQVGGQKVFTGRGKFIKIKIEQKPSLSKLIGWRYRDPQGTCIQSLQNKVSKTRLTVIGGLTVRLQGQRALDNSWISINPQLFTLKLSPGLRKCDHNLISRELSR